MYEGENEAEGEDVVMGQSARCWKTRLFYLLQAGKPSWITATVNSHPPPSLVSCRVVSVAMWNLRDCLRLVVVAQYHKAELHRDEALRLNDLKAHWRGGEAYFDRACIQGSG